MDRIWLSAVVLACLAARLRGDVQSECKAVEAPNGSQLCVQLKIEDGKVAVDREKSFLSPSQALAGRGVALERELFADLDRVVGGMKLPDCPVCRGDLAWTDYLKAFTKWRGDNGAAVAKALMSDEFLGPATVSRHSVPLIFNDRTKPGFFLYNARTGQLSFSVLDPVTDYADARQVELFLPDLPSDSERSRQLRNRLRSLNGRLLSKAGIVAVIGEFYENTGLEPAAEVEFRRPGDGSAVSITVHQGRRINSIGFGGEGLNAARLEELLYILLDDQAFREHAGGWAAELHLAPTAADVSYNYPKDRRPYLRTGELQIQQTLVGQMGYVLSEGAPGDQNAAVNLVNLLVDRTAQAASERKSAPKPAPPVVDAGGLVNAHATPPKQPLEEQAPKHAAGDKRYFLGGGLEYRPGQSVRVFGQAQASRLPGPFGNSSLALTPGWQDSLALAGNFFTDYLLFDRLHRRLSFRVASSVDPEPGRFLSGARQDQKRSGGQARTELEWWRNRFGSLLRFYNETRHDTVSLTAAAGSVTKRNLTTTEFGGLYQYESPESEYPRRIRIEPSLRIGLGLAGVEPGFRRAAVACGYHQELPARHAIDIGGRFEAASGATPIFEMPSFGGAGVARGFRRDDAIGRRLWSVQNELWFPVPVRGDSGGKALEFVKRKIRLAALADVGGVWLAAGSEAGTRAGFGAGVRVIYWPVVLKFDWAYGVGSAATAGSRGKFYFSLSSVYPM